MGVFYVDDGFLGLKYLEWFQGALNVLIGPFRWIVLMANSAKSKTMTFQTGAIWSGISEEAFGWRSTRKGAT